AEIEDVKGQESVTKWAKQSQQAQRISAALWTAQPELAARSNDFDAEHMLLPVANGTLDLQDGMLYDHRREHYFTRLAPVYFDPTAACPTWRSFLDRVLPDPEVSGFVARL